MYRKTTEAKPIKKTQHTLNDGQKDNDNGQKEREVEYYPVNFVIVAVGWTDFVSDTTTGSHTFVQMEHETLTPEKKMLIPGSLSDCRTIIT